MIAEPQIIDKLLVEIEQLPPENRIQLIQRISETLLPMQMETSTFLQYGKYAGGKESTLDDFAIAEWRPQDDWVNGA